MFLLFSWVVLKTHGNKEKANKDDWFANILKSKDIIVIWSSFFFFINQIISTFYHKPKNGSSISPNWINTILCLNFLFGPSHSSFSSFRFLLKLYFYSLFSFYCQLRVSRRAQVEAFFLFNFLLNGRTLNLLSLFCFRLFFALLSKHQFIFIFSAINRQNITTTCSGMSYAYINFYFF